MGKSATRKNALQAHGYLCQSGEKVSRSKFYDDVGKGLIQPRADGFYHDEDLKAYAAAHLKGANTAKTELNEEKTKAEIRKIEAAAARAEVALARESGELIERTTVYKEFLARASKLRIDLEAASHTIATAICTRFCLAMAAQEEMQVTVWEMLEECLDAYSEKRTFVATIRNIDLEEFAAIEKEITNA